MVKRFIFAIVSLLLITLTAVAQKEVSVKSFKLTTDHIPGDQRRNDLNNQPCALVKVQVVDEITLVDGPRIGDIVNRGVEKWVYMCNGSRYMKIHFRNHLPLEVRFSKYGQNQLEGNRVYELTIEIPDASTPVTQTEKTTGGDYLKMKVNPSNSTITIWGDDMEEKKHHPQTDGSFSLYLPYGQYYYRVEAQGFGKKESAVFITNENPLINIQLDASMGKLRIDCPTEKAAFYVDGLKKEKGGAAMSWTGEIKPGIHSVEVRCDGYISQSRTVDIKANQTTTVRFERLVSQQERLQMFQDSINAANKAEQEAKAKALAEAKAREKEERALKNKREKEQQLQHKASPSDSEQGIRFGLRGGLNVSYAELDVHTGDHYGTTTSFHIGPTAEYRLHKHFAIQGAALVSGKGFTNDNHLEDYDMHATAYYLDIPIEATYISFSTDAFQLRLFAGPYAAIGLSGSIKDQRYHDFDDSFFSTYNGFDFGLSAGVSAVFGNHFTIGTNWQFGLAKDYPNRCVGFSLGYIF